MPLVQLDTENADLDLTSQITVLTDTPSATENRQCQAYIAFGDGVKNLTAGGGDFEISVTIGGQTAEPDPQVITFSTAIRTAVWTTVFPVVANQEVVIKVKSPNADADVDVTAYLFDVPVGDTQQWNSSTVATPTVDGVPEVDITYGNGVAISLASSIDANITHITGTPVSLESTVDANVTHVNSTAVSITTEFEADLKKIDGDAQSMTDLKDFADTGYDPSTHLADTDVISVSGSSAAADVLEIMYDNAITSGSVNDGSPTTTSFITNLTEATDEHFTQSAFVFTSGDLLGQVRPVSAYVGGTKTITVSPEFTGAPSNSDTFMILGRVQ